jgi:hypothetical protein
MALDAVAEVVLRFVGEVVLVGIFYWPGWFALRIITLGRYPLLKGKPHSKEFVAAFGFVTLLVCVLMNIPGGGF